MNKNKPSSSIQHSITGPLIWMVVLSTLATFSLLAGVLMIGDPARRILAFGAIGLALILESGAIVMMMRWRRGRRG